MKSVEISASPKQLSRLRNGHRVRIKQAVEGTGFNLIVDPSKFDNISRSFARGSAYQLQLTPEELMSNKTSSSEMEGKGIFSGGRIRLPSTKKLGRTLKKAGETAIKGIRTAESAVRKNPTSRKIVKTVIPLLAQKATEGLLTYAGLDPKTSKELSKASSMGAKEGLKQGGYGLYAGRQEGRGLYAGQQGRGLAGPPSRMPEKSSIGGTLLARNDSNLPPALRSDPMGANFHTNVQLPPNLQRGGIRFV